MGYDYTRRGAEELDRDETKEPGELVAVGLETPPPRIAALIGLAPDEQALRRQWLRRKDDEPSELLTWWIPATVAEGTDLAGAAPLRGGSQAHLAHCKGIHIDHVIEQIVARQPSAHEATLLWIPRNAPLLALYAAAHASGRPVLALDIAMPGDRHQLEDAYQVG